MPSTDLCFLTACELAQNIRAKQISAVEVMQAHIAQIDRVNPQVNAIVTYHPERAPRPSPRGRRRPLARRFRRPPARYPSRPQRPYRHRRRPHNLRLAHLRRPHPRPRRAHRRAPQARRRDLGRQNQHPRIRRRLADIQRSIRRNPQPLRPIQNLRRQQRRRRRWHWLAACCP